MRRIPSNRPNWPNPTSTGETTMGALTRRNIRAAHNRATQAALVTAEVARRSGLSERQVLAVYKATHRDLAPLQVHNGTAEIKP